MGKVTKISDSEFVEIRNALDKLYYHGVIAICLGEESYGVLQDKIEGGWGEKSDYLSNIKIVKV